MTVAYPPARRADRADPSEVDLFRPMVISFNGFRNYIASCQRLQALGVTNLTAAVIVPESTGIIEAIVHPSAIPFLSDAEYDRLVEVGKGKVL